MDFKSLAKPPIIIGATAVIAVFAVVFAYIVEGRRPTESYVTPTTGQIVEEVSSTGAVTAAKTIDLGFQIGGKIVNAGPAVGTHVGAGATLGALSGATLNATLEQAEAALQGQQANLASIEAGTRPESVAVSQSAVTGAQTSVTQSKETVIQAAQDAYQKSDDAIHNKVDQFFSNPRSVSPTLVFTLNNSQDQSSMISGRIAMETLLNSWQQQLAALSSDPNTVNVTTLASMTLTNLNQVSAYLNTVAAGLTEVVPTTAYPTATIQTYQSSIATARANISADVSAINAANTAEKSAESALATAQSQLTLAQAPATAQSLEAQQAQVAAAQANVDAARAQLSQTVISAPISGTITVNNMEPGEIASGGTPEISMISDTQFQFETYVSQADLAKLQVGQPAQVELDAYQTQAPLAAHVIKIDPASTIQNGVSSYKVTLQFDQNDSRIQAGETGSADITTQSVVNALSVPTSAIITDGTQHFVVEKTATGDQQIPVEIGIASADGMTQITSGISSTDQIRSFGTQQ